MAKSNSKAKTNRVQRRPAKARVTVKDRRSTAGGAKPQSRRKAAREKMGAAIVEAAELVADARVARDIKAYLSGKQPPSLI